YSSTSTRPPSSTLLPYTTLFRSPKFALDSDRIRRELEEFLRRDNQLTQLMNRHPKFSSVLSQSYGTEVRALQKRQAKDSYEKLLDRKSTRLNSSHVSISYAVFCL